MRIEITDERYQEILDTYGAHPGNWPDAERAAILKHLRGVVDAAVALEQAGELDTALAWSMVPPPTVALHESVLSCAPRMRAMRRLRLWWLGLGLAGVATAGAFAGVAAAAVLSPVELPGYGRSDATAFGAVIDPAAPEAAE